MKGRLFRRQSDGTKFIVVSDYNETGAEPGWLQQNDETREPVVVSNSEIKNPLQWVPIDS